MTEKKFNRFDQLLFFHWMFHFTQTGIIMFLAMIIAALSSVITTAVPEYHVFCCFISLYFTTGLTALFFRKKVQVICQPQHQCTCNEESLLSFSVLNDSKKETLPLSAAFFHSAPEIFCPKLPDARSASGFSRDTFTLSFISAQRGVYHNLKIGVFSTFPFGIYRCFHGFGNLEKLTVFPSYTPVESLMEIPSGNVSGHQNFILRYGESMEYAGSREYRPGDPAGHIDFRAWARLGKPVIREYLKESAHRAALIIDPEVRNQRRKMPCQDFEGSVSLCAALCDYLYRENYLIEFLSCRKNSLKLSENNKNLPFSFVLHFLSELKPDMISSSESYSAPAEVNLDQLTVCILLLTGFDIFHQQKAAEICRNNCVTLIFIISSRTYDTTVFKSRWPACRIFQLSADDAKKSRILS